MSAPETVGLLGAGRMGLAMAKHLRARGGEVVACDVAPAAREAAAAAGARVVDSASEVGAAAAFVIVAVGYDAEALETTLGPEGAVGAMAPGGLVAISSTVAPETARRIEAAARERGVATLDAPICRGRFYADRGELLALFGGDAATVERGRAVYSAFCSDIEVVGEVGHGQVAKAINNLMLWITSVGLIEAGRLAEASGIDLPTLREALMKSSAKSQALADWEQTSFTWALKDMEIVGRMSDEAGLALPMTGAVKELVKEARRVKATNPPGWSRS